MKKSFSIPCIILASLFLAGIYFFGEETVQYYRKPYYFAPPDVIRHFAFGYNDVYADLLWVRYIQDADYCNFQKGTPVYDGKTKYQCHKGWAFHMVQAITELAPRFKSAYTLSSTIMGVLMGDKEGTRIIVDKAVKMFPEDWEVFFHAGNHYLIELQENEQAAEYLLTAAKKGGPVWLYSLAAKIYTKEGQLDVAEQFLKKIIQDNPNSAYRKSFDIRLKEIKDKRNEVSTSNI